MRLRVRHANGSGLAIVAVAMVALAIVALAGAAPADAIVGGDAAPPGRWPWMAAILDSSVTDAGMAQYCGGVVIGQRRILTAAHCVVDQSSEDIDVLVGRTRLSEKEGRRIAVQSISVYPGYVDGTRRGLDAAVLTLRANAGVAPLALALPTQTAAWAAGTPAWAIGWGQINAGRSPAGNHYYADRLRELQLPVQSDAACENVYGIGFPNFPYRPAWLLCAGTGAGGSGPCFGDSGGPLVVGTPGGWLDVGIVNGGDACAAAGYYTLFARVDRINRFALQASPPSQPDLLALPRVVGEARAGAKVRCTTGRWRGSRARFAYAWTRRGGKADRVLGRAATYRLTALDARRGVTCSVTATSPGGRMTAAAKPLRAASHARS
jgi:secreted trypsin-like serine protease